MMDIVPNDPLKLLPFFASSRLRVGFVFCLLALAGCASAPLYEYEAAPASPSATLSRAQAYLAERPDWNIDCSNFVRACVKSEAMDNWLSGNGGKNLTLSIFRYLRGHGTERKDPSDIRPGDILIFHKTYDANRDGAIDSLDVYTHSGIAESMKDGVLTYIDSSKGRKDPKIRRRSFSFREGGKNERVATDPRTGRAILHRETFATAFGMPKAE